MSLGVIVKLALKLSGAELHSADERLAANPHHAASGKPSPFGSSPTEHKGDAGVAVGDAASASCTGSHLCRNAP
ncbi:hypothetical protein WJX75_001381 [Coccomyxa subellipsoidea]|uniref:Uncharacterized protein n=1 Tax=Coccomyxa subellipsoidea TaxID=248742 RepID=A0ABR2YT42_9CHLO